MFFRKKIYFFLPVQNECTECFKLCAVMMKQQIISMVFGR